MTAKRYLYAHTHTHRVLSARVAVATAGGAGGGVKQWLRTTSNWRSSWWRGDQGGDLLDNSDSQSVYSTTDIAVSSWQTYCTRRMTLSCGAFSFVGWDIFSLVLTPTLTPTQPNPTPTPNPNPKPNPTPTLDAPSWAFKFQQLPIPSCRLVDTRVRVNGCVSLGYITTICQSHLTLRQLTKV